MPTTITDSRGVCYSVERLGHPRFDKKGKRVDGYTHVRLDPRPVDVKRAARKAKRHAKLHP